MELLKGPAVVATAGPSAHQTAIPRGRKWWVIPFKLVSRDKQNCKEASAILLQQCMI